MAARGQLKGYYNKIQDQCKVLGVYSVETKRGNFEKNQRSKESEPQVALFGVCGPLS